MGETTDRWSEKTGQVTGQDWKNAQPESDGSGTTSVPEGPPTARSTTRALGPGSIAGTICLDPQMRFTGNGKAIVKIRLAVSRRVQDPETRVWSDGETEFTDVTVWGRQGENAMESLRKGDRVVVNGIWQEDSWQGRDGQEHSRKTLTVRDIGPSLLFRQARVQRVKEGD